MLRVTLAVALPGGKAKSLIRTAAESKGWASRVTNRHLACPQQIGVTREVRSLVAKGCERKRGLFANLGTVPLPALRLSDETLVRGGR